jgi:hypothetical protein
VASRAYDEAFVLLQTLIYEFICKMVRGEVDHRVAFGKCGRKIVSQIDGGGDGDFLRFSGAEECLAHAAFASSDKQVSHDG